MSKWKTALVFGSVGAGAFLLVTGRRPAGIAVATIGLAVLAAEYPEKFERVWERAPEYLYRGTQIFQGLSRMAERFAEEASRRGVVPAAQEVGSEYLS